jgi:hypothetical protein
MTESESPDPDHVTSREELAQFVLALRTDLAEHPDEWENVTLDRYLEALAAYIADAPGWYRNNNIALPPNGDWTFFARVLAGAAIYE